MPPQFDPYYKWLGIPPAEQPPNHYRLLGLTLYEADGDVISSAADARMIHLRSFQTGQYSNESQKLLNEVAAARICLLKPEKKAAYDTALRQRLQPAAAALPAVQIPTPQRPVAQLPHAQLPFSPTAAFHAAAPMPAAAPTAAAPVPTEETAVPQAAAEGAADALDFTGGRAPRVKKSSAQKSSAPPIALYVGPAVGIVAVIVAIAIFNSQNGGSDSPTGDLTQNPIDERPQPPREKPPADKKTPDLIKRPGTPNGNTPPIIGPNPPSRTGPNTGQPNGSNRPSPATNNGFQPGTGQFNNPTPSNPPPSGDTLTPTPDTPSPSPTSDSTPTIPEPTARPNKPIQTEPSPALVDNPFVPANKDRTAIPAGDAQQKQLAKLHDILKDDFALAKSPDEKLKLARRLVQLAQETKDDPPMAYVMATQGLDLAGRQGDPRIAADAVKLLTEQYDVDNADVISKSIVQLSHTVRTSQARGMVAKAALDLVDPAIAAGKFEIATEFSGIAATLASLEKNPVVRDMAKEAGDRARRAQHWSRDFQTAVDKLAAQPDDPEANYLAGKAYCFGKNDYATGLPLLAKGSDEELKKLAQMELKASDGSNAIVVADAWWDAADKRAETGEKDDPTAKGMRNRAGHWYRLAEGQLSGLQLTKAQKRIADAGDEKAAVVESREVFLDDLNEADSHMGHGNLGKHGARGYDQPDEVRVDGVRPAHALSMHPPANGAATVRYDLPPGYKTFSAQAALMDDSHPKSEVIFKVIADGKPIWNSRPMHKAREIMNCQVSIAGVHQLQLEVVCSGDNGSMHSVWLNPKLKQ